MTQWFLLGPPEQGPFSPKQVLEMVRNGEISRETKLRKDDSAWFAAGEIGGLFEAAVRPTIRYRCPSCREEVRANVHHCSRCGSLFDDPLREVTEHRIRGGQAAEGADRPGQADGGRGSSMQSWLNRLRRRSDS